MNAVQNKENMYTPNTPKKQIRFQQDKPTMRKLLFQPRSMDNENELTSTANQQSRTSNTKIKLADGYLHNPQADR